jgi:hypothetical protein
MINNGLECKKEDPLQDHNVNLVYKHGVAVYFFEAV